MTLDQAIQHLLERGKENGPAAEEDRQLAAWLIELREWRQADSDRQQYMQERSWEKSER